MINVLHLSAVTNWGGGENHITHLCTELSLEQSNTKHLILCAKGGVFEKKLAATSIPFIAAPLAFKMDLRYAWMIIKTVRKHKIDLIHIHDPIALALVVIADRLYSLPKMVFSKKTSFPIKKRKGTLYKYNYPKIKKILCVSEETKRVTALSIQDTSKLITIYHGTKVPKTAHDVPSLSDRFGLSPTTVLVGLIGNHIEAKDLMTFIETVRILVHEKKQKHFRFVQIGTFTEQTPLLLEEVKKQELEEYINFTGHLEQASAYFPQFDLFLMTSQSEGIPQAIYESFYYRKPVISTRVGGIAEVVEHRVTGLLAKAHEAQQLAENIVSLSENADLQHKMTETAYTRLIAHWTTHQMAEKTIAVYKHILSS